MPKFFQPENVRIPVSFSLPSEGSGEASLLIANRGEIAVRIIRAAKKNGIRSVAIYAVDDADSLHVSLADEAVLLSGGTLAETYLNQEKIIQIALESKADAIHPGYGFLSENFGFAQKVADAGLIFIGPSPENIRLMGEKNQALDYVRSLGIPVLKSFRGTIDEILQHAPEMEFPVMVKASGGGGGKGMVICNSAEELIPALEKAERQAVSYFGNGELFVEKYLPHARHIEVQLIADHQGKVLHFHERECSVQRRFQKIIEEAPSPSVNEKLRKKMTSAAVQIARSMNYRNAGTIEFLLDEHGNFYFLEMNTRIQVEHPVTEMITNMDLVSMQLLVAAGNPLPVDQKDIQISGHAIEVRLCAEDAENNFKPSSGRLSLWQFSENEHLRLETFVKVGGFVSPNYDSLLAKLIVWGESRSLALVKMQHILAKTGISGVHTNLAFLSGLIESEVFQENQIYTRYVDENLDLINAQIQAKKLRLNKHKLVIAYLIFHFQQKKHSGNSVWNQIGFWRIMPFVEVFVVDEKYESSIKLNSGDLLFRINGGEYQVSVIRLNGNLLELEINQQHETFYCLEDEKQTQITYHGFSFELRSNLLMKEVLLNRKNSMSEKIFQNLICADLFGKVLKIHISEGDVVQSGQILLTLESMKTEVHVLCPVGAKVKKVHVKEGNAVVEKQLLVELDEN
ncbi:MAG: biotin carboxylase N-terminal domain-containing protein [Bacteroidota bacterium]|nr:methylcrotonoyl-CoA carboxylase [Odoribacter sp.]MDP3643415.1 biotin carboxylase N-terminal domain-containing protein [Bacteroidota bacterium]